MDPFNVLVVGRKYSKQDLATILNQPTLAKIREGVATVKNSNSYFLFVDLEKEGKEERFHFDDFFEEDFFHWDSQTTQHINSPKIQEIITAVTVPHLFVRVRPKIKHKTLPFIYCGRLSYHQHDVDRSKPVHIVFNSIDYDDYTDNHDLLEIYHWAPSKVGKTPKTKISKKGIVSERRQNKYQKPNETERMGLVTSRVGQGYYRQQIIEKWGGRCPISRVDSLPILIASHIVPWSESSDAERLDVDNGILLSPVYDSLFDRHLISFQDNGAMIISASKSRISPENIERLQIPSDVKIPVTEGMLTYIRRHRDTFNQLELNDTSQDARPTS